MVFLRRSCRGQASVEMALALALGIVPLTLAFIAFVEVAWTYHALATITRQGARYASTHCWQDSAGSNVVNWLQMNAPAFPDRPQLLNGGIQLLVTYWAHDPSTHQSIPFACGDSCSPQCVPDSVTVSVNGYEFSHLLPLLHLAPLRVPSFSTTVEMESVGADPDRSISVP